MRVGDMVRSLHEVRTNPVVNESRGWKPIKAGYIGIVLNVKQTDMNAWINTSGKGDVYVDVMLSVNGESVRCGNHHSGGFEVVE